MPTGYVDGSANWANEKDGPRVSDHCADVTNMIADLFERHPTPWTLVTCGMNVYTIRDANGKNFTECVGRATPDVFVHLANSYAAGRERSSECALCHKAPADYTLFAICRGCLTPAVISQQRETAYRRLREAVVTYQHKTLLLEITDSDEWGELMDTLAELDRLEGECRCMDYTACRTRPDEPAKDGGAKDDD